MNKIVSGTFLKTCKTLGYLHNKLIKKDYAQGNAQVQPRVITLPDQRLAKSLNAAMNYHLGLP